MGLSSLQAGKYDAVKGIIEFNQTNERYFVTIRNYHTQEGPDVTRQRLNADMAAGNGPDIIDMYGSSYYLSYINNGYLENLSPYLEQSEYKDDIIWNVLNAYEVDGGIYLFLSQFLLYGVCIHPDYAQYVEEWNIETFYDLIDRNQWEKFIYSSPAYLENLLYNVLAGRQEEFIHLDEKTAEFDIFYNGNLIGDLLDYRIWDVISEEIPAYFAGDKTAEGVAHIIQNRVQIILQE